MSGKNSKSPGPQTATRVDKPWGHQLLFTSAGTYSGAVDIIRKGHSLSLQYHRQRDETLFLHQGRLQIELEDGTGVMRTCDLQAGQSIRFLPMRKHRIHAVEDSVVFEVANGDMSDVIRLADHYGRAAARSDG